MPGHYPRSRSSLLWMSVIGLGCGQHAIADDQTIRHSTVPAGTTHWQRWPVTDAIMSKSLS